MKTKDEETNFPTLETLGAELHRLAIAEVGPGARTARRRNLVRIGAATTGAVAISVGAALLLTSGDKQPLGATPAQAELQRLADQVAVDGQDLTLGDGQFLYERSFGSGGGIIEDPDGGYMIPPSSYSERTLEKWTDRSGQSWVIEDKGDGPETQAPVEFHDASGPAFAEGMSYDEVLALPRDPQLLYEQAQDGMDGDFGELASRDAAFNYFGAILSEPLPLDLQSALIDAAALAPGTKLVGDITTPIGTTVTAVSYDNGNGVAWELLFDPDTGEYAGRTIVLNGKRYYDGLILKRGVVDAVGQTP